MRIATKTPVSLLKLGSSTHQGTHTHCVFCGRKNYRLQDIQLSKSWLHRSATNANPHNQAKLETGGEYRARTGDLLVANQALSQLS
jgi:ribosomal protein L37E